MFVGTLVGVFVGCGGTVGILVPTGVFVTSGINLSNKIVLLELSPKYSESGKLPGLKTPRIIIAFFVLHKPPPFTEEPELVNI